MEQFKKTALYIVLQVFVFFASVFVSSFYLRLTSKHAALGPELIAAELGIMFYPFYFGVIFSLLSLFFLVKSNRLIVFLFSSVLIFGSLIIYLAYFDMLP